MKNIQTNLLGKRVTIKPHPAPDYSNKYDNQTGTISNVYILEDCVNYSVLMDTGELVEAYAFQLDFKVGLPTPLRS